MNDFATDEFKAALQKYEEAREKGETVFLDADDFADICEYYNLNGRTDEAFEVIDYAVSIYEDAALPLVMRARMALVTEKNVEKAKAYLGKVANTADLDYVLMHAEIMLHEQHTEAARSYCEEVLQQLSDDDADDFVLDVADLLCDYEQKEMALQWHQRHYSDLSSLEGRKMTAKLYYENDKFEESVVLLKEILDSDPYAHEEWTRLSITYLSLGQYPEAIESAEYALAIDPKFYLALSTKANALYEMGNYDEAVTYYRRFLEIEQKNPFVHYFLGLSLVHQMRFEEVLVHLQKAEELIVNPTSEMMHELYQNIIEAYKALGRAEDAFACVEKFSKYATSELDVKLMFGDLCYAAGRHDEGKEAFSDIMRAVMVNTERFEELTLKMGISLFYNKVFEQAINLLLLFVESTEVKKGTPGFSFLSAAYLALGKTGEALIFLERAVTLNPGEAKDVLGGGFPEHLSPEEYYIYAKKMWKTGDKD